MNPYVGDRQLEPDDVCVCPHCDAEFYLLRDLADHVVEHGEIDMNDPGEPNEDPD